MAAIDVIGVIDSMVKADGPVVGLPKRAGSLFGRVESGTEMNHREQLELKINSKSVKEIISILQERAKLGEDELSDDAESGFKGKLLGNTMLDVQPGPELTELEQYFVNDGFLNKAILLDLVHSLKHQLLNQILEGQSRDPGIGSGGESSDDSIEEFGEFGDAGASRFATGRSVITSGVKDPNTVDFSPNKLLKDYDIHVKTILQAISNEEKINENLHLYLFITKIMLASLKLKKEILSVEFKPGTGDDKSSLEIIYRNLPQEPGQEDQRIIVTYDDVKEIGISTSYGEEFLTKAGAVGVGTVEVNSQQQKQQNMLNLSIQRFLEGKRITQEIETFNNSGTGTIELDKQHLLTIITTPDAPLYRVPRATLYLDFLLVLVLSGCGIKYLPSDLYKLIHLSILDLSNNEISSIDESSASLGYSLDNFNMEGNLLCRPVPGEDEMQVLLPGDLVDAAMSRKIQEGGEAPAGGQQGNITVGQKYYITFNNRKDLAYCSIIRDILAGEDASELINILESIDKVNGKKKISINQLLTPDSIPKYLSGKMNSIENYEKVGKMTQSVVGDPVGACIIELTIGQGQDPPRYVLTSELNLQIDNQKNRFYEIEMAKREIASDEAKRDMTAEQQQEQARAEEKAQGEAQTVAVYQKQKSLLDQVELLLKGNYFVGTGVKAFVDLNKLDDAAKKKKIISDYVSLMSFLKAYADFKDPIPGLDECGLGANIGALGQQVGADLEALGQKVTADLNFVYQIWLQNIEQYPTSAEKGQNLKASKFDYFNVLGKDVKDKATEIKTIEDLRKNLTDSIKKLLTPIQELLTNSAEQQQEKFNTTEEGKKELEAELLSVLKTKGLSVPQEEEIVKRIPVEERLKYYLKFGAPATVENYHFHVQGQDAILKFQKDHLEGFSLNDVYTFFSQPSVTDGDLKTDGQVYKKMHLLEKYSLDASEAKKTFSKVDNQDLIVNVADAVSQYTFYSYEKYVSAVELMKSILNCSNVKAPNLQELAIETEFTKHPKVIQIENIEDLYQAEEDRILNKALLEIGEGAVAFLKGVVPAINDEPGGLLEKINIVLDNYSEGPDEFQSNQNIFLSMKQQASTDQNFQKIYQLHSEVLDNLISCLEKLGDSSEELSNERKETSEQLEKWKIMNPRATDQEITNELERLTTINVNVYNQVLQNLKNLRVGTDLVKGTYDNQIKNVKMKNILDLAISYLREGQEAAAAAVQAVQAVEGGAAVAQEVQAPPPPQAVAASPTPPTPQGGGGRKRRNTKRKGNRRRINSKKKRNKQTNKQRYTKATLNINTKKK